MSIQAEDWKAQWGSTSTVWNKVRGLILQCQTFYFYCILGKIDFWSQRCLLWYPKPQEFLSVTELVTPLGSPQQLDFGGFLSAFNDFELLFFICFCVGYGGRFAWQYLFGVKFVSACLFAFIFVHFSSCTRVFNSQSRIHMALTIISACICGFTANSRVCPQFFLLEDG